MIVYLLSRALPVALLLALSGWALISLDRIVQKIIDRQSHVRFRLFTAAAFFVGVSLLGLQTLRAIYESPFSRPFNSPFGMYWLTLVDLQFVYGYIVPLMWLFIIIFSVLAGAVLLSGVMDQNEKIRQLAERPRPVEIEEFAKRLIESDELLTAFRTALPIGAKDPDFGLDYIPFLLFDLDKQKREFSASSHRFLGWTVLLGSILSFVMVYYGYILLNETAAGTPRLLSRLQDNVGAVRRALPTTSIGGELSTEFHNALDSLRTLPPGAGNVTLHSRLVKLVDSTTTTGQLHALLDSLRVYAISTSVRDSSGELYRTALNSLAGRTRSELERGEVVLHELSQSTQEIQSLLDAVQENLEQPENRVAEILKRLGVGLIVVTFFLALLRYTAGLYRDQYRQLLKTYEDDQTIRRFYVTFKSSSQNPEQRALVLESFLQKGQDTGVAMSPPEEASKEELQMLKEIVNALAKKI